MRYLVVLALCLVTFGGTARASIPDQDLRNTFSVVDWQEVEIPACYINATAQQAYWMGVVNGSQMAEYRFVSSGKCTRMRVRLYRSFLFWCQRGGSFDCSLLLIWTPTGWLYGVLWPK